MRKWVAIAIMLITIIAYYIILREQPVSRNKKDIAQSIEKIQFQLQETYPNTPKEVVELHNRLMDILYGKDITNEQIDTIIQLQRKLYAEEFLLLNPEEVQLENIHNELLQNREKGFKVISSKTLDSYYEKSELVRVGVIHYTNSHDISRQYMLKQENQWKICGWEEE